MMVYDFFLLFGLKTDNQLCLRLRRPRIQKFILTIPVLSLSPKKSAMAKFWHKKYVLVLVLLTKECSSKLCILFWWEIKSKKFWHLALGPIFKFSNFMNFVVASKVNFYTNSNFKKMKCIALFSMKFWVDCRSRIPFISKSLPWLIVRRSKIYILRKQQRMVWDGVGGVQRGKRHNEWIL